MTIELIDESECSTRGKGGGRTKGEKYGKYAVAIAKSVPWIKEEIEKSKDGMIRVKVEDIAREMGPDFIKRHHTSLGWGLKYVLFNEGIVVDAGTHKDGKTKLFVMRMATNEDILPPSLNKYLEPEEDST